MILLLFYAWQAALGAQGKADAGASGDPGSEKPVPVAARAWVDAPAVRDGVTAKLWVVIDNRSDSPVTIRFNAFSTPGFTRGPRCWSVAGVAPACVAGSDRPLTTDATVAAHDSVTLWADITRTASEIDDGGSAILTGTFRWTRQDAAASTNVTLATPPVDLASTLWLKRPGWVAFRDIFVPLLLSTLGGLLAFWTYRYQQSRTERQAIWTEMMEKVTRDAEQHLMPVSSAAASLVSAATRWRKSRSDPDCRDLLHRLVMLNRRLNYMADTIGAFYFRLLSAETLASASWHAFKERQRVVLKQQDALDRILTFIGPTTTGGAFGTKRETEWKGSTGFKADVGAVESSLAAFVGREAFAKYEVQLLELFQRVIDVEVNRAFSKWYGEEPLVNRRELKQFRTAFNAQPAGVTRTDEHQNLLKALNWYLDETAPLWWLYRPFVRRGRTIADAWKRRPWFRFGGRKPDPASGSATGGGGGGKSGDENGGLDSTDPSVQQGSAAAEPAPPAQKDVP
jgi:hypothetical protein